MGEAANGPLAGLKVLDLADETGLYCTKMLANLGAEVIKIEPPGGDLSRSRGPFYGNEPHREKSLFWFHYNTNKKGITLNLETDEGRELFRQHVDASMHASLPVTLMVAAPVYERSGRVVGRSWNWHTEAANGVFPCGDGYIDFRLRLQRWDDFIKWLDTEGLAGELKEERWKDPWFRQEPEQVKKIDEIFCRFLMKRTKQELYEEGQKRGFEIGPAYTIPEVAASKQLGKRNYFLPVEHPELGAVLQYLGAPFRSSLTPWQITGRAPLLGEHNEEVYGKELGLDRKRLIRLREEGVI